jgi:UDP-glucose 4-epimerase
VQEMVEQLLPVLAAVGIKDVEVRQAAPRLGDVKRNFSDTSKASRMLGWRAAVELKVGLRRTVDWFMDQAGDL